MCSAVHLKNKSGSRIYIYIYICVCVYVCVCVFLISWRWHCLCEAPDCSVIISKSLGVLDQIKPSQKAFVYATNAIHISEASPYSSQVERC